MGNIFEDNWNFRSPHNIFFLLRAVETETHFRIRVLFCKPDTMRKWISVYILYLISNFLKTKFQFTSRFQFTGFSKSLILLTKKYSLPQIFVYSKKQLTRKNSLPKIFQFTLKFFNFKRFEFTLNDFCLPQISVYLRYFIYMMEFSLS